MKTHVIIAGEDGSFFCGTDENWKDCFFSNPFNEEGIRDFCAKHNVAPVEFYAFDSEEQAEEFAKNYGADRDHHTTT